MLEGGVGSIIAPTAIVVRCAPECGGTERPPIRQKYPPEG